MELPFMKKNIYNPDTPDMANMHVSFENVHYVLFAYNCRKIKTPHIVK